MGNSQKIATLLRERQNIEREIAKLQGLCDHPSASVRSVRERLDSTTTVIRYVCDECFSVVGIPNNDDLQKYLKQ